MLNFLHSFDQLCSVPFGQLTPGEVDQDRTRTDIPKKWTTKQIFTKKNTQKKIKIKTQCLCWLHTCTATVQ